MYVFSIFLYSSLQHLTYLYYISFDCSEIYLVIIF